MAKIAENEKGFRVMEITRSELLCVLQEHGSIGICDDCGERSPRGYYVAVLNRWLCPECYRKWYEGAVNYPEDRKYEEGNFNMYRQLFEV